MAVLALELNGAGVTAVSDREGAGETIPASPGYALLDGDRLGTGPEAAQRARLKPRFTHSRFWEEIDTTPLSRPFPKNLSRADLAHAHLEGIWRSLEPGATEVLLTVPGWYTDGQLGLILGVAHACDMPVTGIVDSAVAASALRFSGQKLLHLDLHLHRAVATELEQAEGIRRRRVEVNEQVGLVSLLDDWAKLIARIFVHQTRFDPLYRAASEQILCRYLPRWLEELSDREAVPLRMEASGKEYTIELTREQALHGARAGYQQIAQLVESFMGVSEPPTLLLSHRLAELPGLEERLSRDLDVAVLPVGAAASGALAMRDRIPSRREDGELTFVTSLRFEDVRAKAGGVSAPMDAAMQGPEPSKAKPRPTHVVVDGIAHRITPEPFVLGAGIPEGSRGLDLGGEVAGISRDHCSIYRNEDRVLVEDHSSFGSFLNGKRLEGIENVAAGDRLRLGHSSIEVQLIQVLTISESLGSESHDSSHT